MDVRVDWSTIKNFVDSREISLQWYETNDSYEIAAIDGAFRLDCSLRKRDPKESDQIDFEDNYKDFGNQSDTQMDWFQRMSLQGNVYATGTAFSSISLGNIAFLLLTNTSSTKTIHMFRAVFSTDSVQVRSIYRFYSNPTVSNNGTQVPIINQKQSSIKTSEMTAYQLPTVSDFGDFLTSRILPQGSPTQSFDLPYLYSIDPGESVLFSVQNSVLAANSQITVVWVEL